MWRPSPLAPPSPPSTASTPPSVSPSLPLVKRSEEGAASATAGKCCQGAAICPSFNCPSPHIHVPLCCSDCCRVRLHCHHDLLLASLDERWKQQSSSSRGCARPSKGSTWWRRAPNAVQVRAAPRTTTALTRCARFAAQGTTIICTCDCPSNDALTSVVADLFVLLCAHHHRDGGGRLPSQKNKSGLLPEFQDCNGLAWRG